MSGECDVVVIGGGMAAMSAALTVAREGLSATILTGGVPGGQLLSIEHIDGVPGYAEMLAGYDLCPITQEQCDALGVVFVTEKADAITAAGDGWKVSSVAGDIATRAIIFATGTALAKLGVPGEAELTNKGVSECASCDGPLLRGKIAVVAGGGDSAMQEALTLADHVAQVIMIERTGQLNGQADYRTRVEENDKIEIRFGTEITAILGESEVTGVRVKDIATGAESESETAAVFVFAGLVPNSNLLKGVADLDATGRVSVDAALRSSARGITAAGNVRSGSSHRAAGAMGDGATAAVTIASYLATGQWRDA